MNIISGDWAVALIFAGLALIITALAVMAIRAGAKFDSSEPGFRRWGDPNE